MPYNPLSPGSAISISNSVGIGSALVRFSRRSYAVDYIALISLLTAWVLIQIFVTPFYQLFSLDDRDLQYPFAVVERVSVFWCIIYAGVIPLFIILTWTVLGRSGVHKTQVTILGFLVAILLTTFVTDVIKNAVGMPRPDLISRCKPTKGTPKDVLVGYTVCTQDNNHILQEGWRSFPSGHSSFAFAGFGYLSLFFSGQTHALRPHTDLFRCLLALLPLFGAVMIATSRLQDYRHDVYDVSCGSILGILIAYFSYRRYYPPLRSAWCNTPYNKTEASGPDGLGKLPGDEEQAVSREEGSYFGETLRGV